MLLSSTVSQAGRTQVRAPWRHPAALICGAVWIWRAPQGHKTNTWRWDVLVSQTQRRSNTKTIKSWVLWGYTWNNSQIIFQDLSASKESRNQHSDQIPNVARLARHNFQHSLPRRKLGSTSYPVYWQTIKIYFQMIIATEKVWHYPK